jgi:hypothetical protein
VIVGTKSRVSHRFFPGLLRVHRSLFTFIGF